jgi:heme/copper-type cytochrome/quinol oxidase subunit 4
MNLGTIVYALCALTSLGAAALLLRGYRRSRVPLLLWTGICFVFLAVNNVLLFVDLRLLPETDLSVVRTVPAVIGVAVLVYGLIWEMR